MLTGSSKRVAINSIAMYVKMLLSLFVTFYSTRIILNNLGVTDFGIYNLVAGTISLLGFFNGTMGNTVQRFLAFELGRGDLNRVKLTLNMTLAMHILCGICLVLVLEILGLFLFDSVFIIKPSRIDAAKIAYHFMVFITFISTVTTPFNACLCAHEYIMVSAFIEFLEALFKLGVAFLIALCGRDPLITFCFFLCLIQIISFFLRVMFCKYKFTECKSINIFKFDKNMRNSLFSFLGWNMIESISWLGKNQGVAVLLNTFYGTAINAAYGVANQINGQIMFFSNSLLSAIRPQIYKAGGTGNSERMIKLSITASKFAFFVLLVMFCPFIDVMDKILVFWLKNVPDYTEGISTLLLIITLISYMVIGINICIQADGKVKYYQIVSSLIIFISLPIGYVISSIYHNVYTFLYVMIIVELILTFSKYYVASKTLRVSMKLFIYKLFFPCTSLAIISIFISYYGYRLLINNSLLINNICYIFIDVLIICLLIFKFGLTTSEKQLILSLLSTVKDKILRKNEKMH